ncbi:MAG: YtxH domain-containing protein [Verrucomicrobia bacterium]|nr:MAG: YtxH domain-containing protein [Verrucomicrobiota bacterium]
MTVLVRMLIGGAVGAAIGFAMYKFVGCKTGACPLTGNPFISMAIYGGIGAMLAAGK